MVCLDFREISVFTGATEFTDDFESLMPLPDSGGAHL